MVKLFSIAEKGIPDCNPCPLPLHSIVDENYELYNPLDFLVPLGGITQHIPTTQKLGVIYSAKMAMEALEYLT